MNIKKYTITKYSPFAQTVLNADDSLFFVDADRRDTRTGHVLSITVAVLEHKAFQATQWNCEQIQDEKEVLQAFSLWCESHSSHMIGFNSFGFAVPFIHARCKAYHFQNPFDNHQTSDLLHLLQPINERLRLPSLTPSFIVKWLGTPDLHGIESMLACASLLTYGQLFAGRFTINHAEKQEDHLLVKGIAEIAVPHAVTCIKDPYHLVVKDTALTCTITLYQGRLRVYYKNYHDYRFFPAEDIAIHKAIARYSDRDVSVPATPQTCYDYTSCPKFDQQGLEQLRAYLGALFTQ